MDQAGQHREPSENEDAGVEPPAPKESFKQAYEQMSGPQLYVMRGILVEFARSIHQSASGQVGQSAQSVHRLGVEETMETILNLLDKGYMRISMKKLQTASGRGYAARLLCWDEADQGFVSRCEILLKARDFQG